MNLKTRIAQVKRRLDALNPPGRVFVVWDDNEVPEIGSDDTLIRVVHRKVKSIDDEAERRSVSSTMPRRLNGR